MNNDNVGEGDVDNDETKSEPAIQNNEHLHDVHNNQPV